jgi:hypothetical protein
MDKIYQAELNQLREKNIRFSEVGCLALDEEKLGKAPYVMSRYQRLLFVFHLYRAMYDGFRSRNDLDELVACFHPKHEFIYEFLAFHPLGGVKSYGAVQGSPAVARHLIKIDTQLKALADPRFQDLMFYWEKAPRAVSPWRFSPEEFKSLFVEKSDVVASATLDQLMYLKQCYPGYGIENAVSNPRVGSSLSGLMDSLVSAAGKKGLNGASKSVASPGQAQRLSSTLQSMGIEKDEHILMAISDRCEREWQTVRQAAQISGAHAVGFQSKMESAKVFKIFDRFLPAVVILEERSQLALVPVDFFDELKGVILLDDARQSDAKTCLLEVLLSPPITNPSQMFSWAEMVGSAT